MQINGTISFAISITTPNTTDADHCTDGGSASAPIMLRNVGIMSPLLSSTWNQSLHCSWELSPSQYVLHPKKKKRKEHQHQTFKTKAIENQLKNQTFQKKKSYGKSIQLIKNCTTVRWWSSLQDKVLSRKVAAKRVEDGADKQSACSQVLVRQISQLANAASGDSFITHEKCCLLLHLLFEPAVEQPSQLNSRPCNPHICMSLHMHQCKSLLVIWT